MTLLRLLALALFPVAYLVLLRTRVRTARSAAAAANARIEATLWAQSPRRLRALALMGVTLVLGFLGRLGPVLSLLFAAVAAPLAASGTIRLLTVTSAGLVIDSTFVPWDQLAGFAIDPPTRRLALLHREPGREAIALSLVGGQLELASRALGAHLPEIRGPSASAAG
jgi:hypothetical protein